MHPTSSYLTKGSALKSDTVVLTSILTALKAVGVAVLIMLLFFIASYFSLGRQLETARSNVRAAFASGELLPGANKALGNTILGVHQFNDCLILGMSIDQRPGLERELLVSPIRAAFSATVEDRGVGATLPPTIVERSDPAEPCPVLYHLAEGDTPLTGVEYYHRYLHGQTILVRYLLPVMSVNMIRLLYSSLLSLTVTAGFAYSLIMLATGVRHATYLVWAVVFVAFSRWFGLESFGQSLSHGPSDLIIVAYLLFLCIASRRGLGAPALLMSSAVFGSLTMIFEFLTGGLPLGAALMIGLIPLVLRQDAARLRMAGVTLQCLLAFATAAVACIVLKILIALATFGFGVLPDFFDALGKRMSIGDTSSMSNGGLMVFGSKIIGGLSGLAGNMRLLAGLTIALAVVAGIWGFTTIRMCSLSDRLREQSLFLLASNVVIPVWLVAFWQHTIQHAWFMDRILVWPIASGFALFTLGVHQRSYGRSAPSRLRDALADPSPGFIGDRGMTAGITAQRVD